MKRRSFLKGLAAFAAVPGTIRLTEAAPAGEWQHIASVPLCDAKTLDVTGQPYEDIGPLTLIRFARRRDEKDWLLADKSGRFKRIRITSFVADTKMEADELAHLVEMKARELYMDHLYELHGEKWREIYRTRLGQMA